MKELKETSLLIDKSIASLETLIGSDAFYDSELGDSILRQQETAYRLIEEAYGLPEGDMQWLEEAKWGNKKRAYYTPSGLEYVIDSLERYVEVVSIE